MQKITRCFSLVALTLSAAPSARGQYVAIDLHPAGVAQSYARSVSGGQQVGGINTSSGGGALLWSGSAVSAQDLTPNGFGVTHVMSVSGGKQAGYGLPPGGQNNHALLWAGNAVGYTDLNPYGFDASQILAVGGEQQVGFGTPTKHPKKIHALLWSGSAFGGVDITPSTFNNAVVAGLGGIRPFFGASQLVGYGDAGDNSTTPTHALLWIQSGVYYGGYSATDMHPSGMGLDTSYALGTDGAQQVGYGATSGGTPHALLWAGSAASAVDLNGTYAASIAYGAAGGLQVGFGMRNGHSHALLWFGSPDRVMDLNQFLPSGFTDAGAFGVDAEGNIVGWASAGANNQFTTPQASNPMPTHAFLWKPTRTVSGQITLEGSVNAAQPLTFAFRPANGSASFTRAATLGSDGSFALNSVPPGSYSLAIKGSRWLQKVVPLDTMTDSVSGVEVTLLPGDISGDNKVDIADLGLLADAFNSTSTDANWNESADLNCDNAVDITDLGLLADNFNTQGDP